MKFMLIFFVFVPSLAFGSELADLYKKQDNNPGERFKHSRSHKEVNWDKHGIAEIGLERTRCYGTCPAYTLIIKNDGSFNYNGHMYVSKLGKHTGTISKWKLRTLLQFINDSKYNSLQNSYSRSISDNPTVYTMVKMNGKTKVISNYANSGPTKLWAIEQLIDSLLLEAKWDQKK